MRLTNNVMYSNLKRNLSNNLRSLAEMQDRLTSQRMIRKPSDDPAGTVESLRLASRLRECKQYQSNVQDAVSWLESTDDTLNHLTEILNRAHELTVYAANGTLSREDRSAIADEVQQIIGEVETIANATQGDRYLFGGTNTQQKPYDGGAWNSNTQKIYYEIGAGVTLPVNITAQEVFLEKDLLGTLQSIYDHMVGSDLTSLSGSDLENLQENIDQVLSCRAQAGARLNRLEMATERLQDQELNFMTLQTEVDGLDMALAVVDLKNQESVYQASLAVGARVIMPTLVDFLS
ncbi:MAG: flagellar hook-associated protein FlgL [Peptococcaceae bacterium]|jgi:flagellar hook-associated protein 3 FlgL|nr:flagellar hook-associated protein FlgL [Peptococcaceae bacterium]MDH7524781.1 flagellar hook-associated protein FlgL [Peptococcaceae bacterium]